MKKWWYISAGLGIVGLAISFYVCSSAEFRMKHPRFPEAVIKVTAAGAFVQQKVVIEAPASGDGQPQAEVPERKFDFKYMDPLTSSVHKFVVRNRGVGPLTLDVASTTCKCTVAGAKDRVVLPGAETTVALEWNTGKQEQYSHSATIKTNDPNLPEFELRVQGRVRRRLSAEPRDLAFGGISPGTGPTLETVVYSQVWDSLEVIQVNSQIAGVAILPERVNPAEVPPELEAKTAYRIKVTLPATLPAAPFQDSVRIRVKDVATDEEELLEVPLHGRVIRPLSMYGEIVRDTGELELGNVAPGFQAQVLIKVRDAQPELGEVQVTTSAPYLTGVLIPNTSSQTKGLYTLKLQVAEDAPPCHHLVDELRVKLNLQTEHPRLGTATFPVRFSVQ